METKFYKYANEFLPAKYINVFADAEEKKDLYKFSNTDVLNLIKLCECPGTMDVEDIIALINKYYNDYENAVYHDDIGKQIITQDTRSLVGSDRVKDVRILTKTEVYSIAKRLKRASWRYIILGAYEGIGAYGKKDLLETTANQIDIEHKTISLPSGHTFTYSDELIQSAIESSQEDYFEDASGRIFLNARTGRILRVVDSSKGNGILSYPSLQRYYYSIKDMTGNSCIGWARLAMSGFYNSLNERLEGKQYREKDRDKVIDILERYNKTSLKTISIQNLRYFRKVVK